jgi:cellulose synthase/poly-beta-1,6-N-acetylglucosamine synthase-like glycosyltransferase
MMSERLLRWAALPPGVILLLFNLRRLIFTLAVLKRETRPAAYSATSLPPSVLVLVPCRNETIVLPGLIDSLARLEYPADRLRVAFVDDGSRDDTRAIIQRAAGREGWYALTHDMSHGKAEALNSALAHVPFGEVIVVYDADHRPRPDSLRKLTAVFDDPSVAGASGRTRLANPTASLFAYYAAVEGCVHQMVTVQAKHRLGLAPALLGSNCAYRRSVLAQAGGFRPGTLLEDSDLTLVFSRMGYRLCFVPESIAVHQAPESASEYLRQHTRWARGFYDLAREHGASVMADRRLPLHLRIELALFSLGYLDRLALLAGLGLALVKTWKSVGKSALDSRRQTTWGFLGCMLGLSVTMPLVQILTAFSRVRAPCSMWIRLPAIPLVFVLDVLSTVRAALESMLQRPRVWAPTSRQRMSK